ncbi:hypothetical protein EJ08DRAFT_665654 [Tothia fuscella]|uniref:DUF7580 domain-containing protein n=1 Tax=Tothia fuscella TaxID=1048955 RepID=A0A9P4NGG2_9PEZI|nr:hypothetical protein EJ08DRAFT_665654 [Tothia fuscella]
MSGIEAAGVALAAIPLIVSVLEHYADGITTMRKWKRYPKELRSIISRLRTQEEILRNSCELLLQGVAISGQEMEMLVSDPLGAGWASEDLHASLREKLLDSYEVHMGIIAEIKNALLEFKRRLGLKDAQQTLVTWDVGESQRVFKTFKEQLKRTKFTLKRTVFDDIFKTFDANNAVLDRLINQNHRLEASRQEKRSRRGQSALLQDVRRGADAVFDAINSALKTTCRETHRRRSVKSNTADFEFPIIISHSLHSKEFDSRSEDRILWSELRLRLVLPQVEKDASIQANSGQICGNLSKEMRSVSGQMRFPHSPKPTVRFVMGSEQNGSVMSAQGLIVDKVNSRSQIIPLTTAAAPIRDLCFALRTFRQTKPDDGIGTLISKRQHFAVTSSQISHSYIGRIDYESRVVVASSILGLYGTHWVGRLPFKTDIYFVSRNGKVETDHIFTSKEIFPDHIPRAGEDDFNPNPPRHIRNLVIFSLGLLLIELCFGKPIEAVPIPGPLLWKNGTLTDLTTYEFLINTIREGLLDKEMGHPYTKVVENCLFCTFTNENPSLDNDGFRQAVLDGIVTPLEGILIAFE